MCVSLTCNSKNKRMKYYTIAPKPFEFAEMLEMQITVIS